MIVETVEKWENVNDNDDPFSFNWDYYNHLYEMLFNVFRISVLGIIISILLGNVSSLIDGRNGHLTNALVAVIK